MRKQWKQILSALLAAAMLATMLVVPAAADPAAQEPQAGDTVTVRYFPVASGKTDVAAAAGYENNKSFFTLTGSVKIANNKNRSYAFNGGGNGDADVTLTDYIQWESSNDFTISFTAPYAGTLKIGYLASDGTGKKIDMLVNGSTVHKTGAGGPPLVVEDVPQGQQTFSRNSSLKVFYIEFTYTVGRVILDFTELDAAITAAEGKLNNVQPSDDGSDVLTTDTWATQMAINTLKAAIADAKSAKETVKSEQALADALAAINDAADAFVPQAGSNTGVDDAYTVTAVTIQLAGADAGEAKTIALGDTLTLTAAVEVTPSDGTAVKWESATPDVASVENGVVTAKKVGSAVITATSLKNIGKSDSITINVANKTVAVNKMGAGLAVGDTLDLTAKVMVGDEEIDEAVTWASGNADIAGVEDGTVTAKAPGVAVISAKTAADITGTCTVVVAPTDPSADILQPDTYELKPTGYTEKKNIPAGKALDAKGYFTAVGDGELQERVQSSTNIVQIGAKASSAVQFTVAGMADSVEVSYGSTDSSNVSSIALVNSAGELMASKAGATITTYTGKGPTTVTYETLAAGTYQIVAPAVEGTFASNAANPNSRGVRIHSVKVVQAAAPTDPVLVESITVNGEGAVRVEESIDLTAAVAPNNAANKAVTWSSDSAKATVDPATGVVTGVAATGEGESVTITATAADGSGVTGTKAITVLPKRVPVESIQVTAAGDATEVEVWKTLALSAAVSPDNATEKTVTWSSSDTTKASVSTSGVVTGKAAGSVTITATAGDASGVTGTIDLTVVAGEQSEIVVDAGKAAEGRYVLDVNGIDEGNYHGTSPKAGTQKDGAGYFTIYYSKENDKGLVDAPEVPLFFDDGYVASHRLNFGGPSKGVTERVVTFAAAYPKAKVTVWWGAGGAPGGSNDGERHVAIWDSAGAVVAEADAVANGEKDVFEYTLTAAGTYAVAGLKNTCYIYKIQVEDAESQGSDPVDPGPVDPGPSDPTPDDPTPVDKTALTEAIAAAEEAKKDVTVQDGPASSVTSGKKFVSQGVMDALDHELAKARQTAADSAATADDVAAAAGRLSTAVETFLDAVETGTYVSGGSSGSSGRPAYGSGAASATVSGSAGTTTVATDSKGTITETTRADDGTVTTTRLAPDGTVTATVIAPDGGKAETRTTPDGAVAVTVTAADGEVLASISLPAALPTGAIHFDDVPQDHWAAKAIDQMAGLGMVNGVGPNTYDMVSDVTRAAVAAMFFRLSNGAQGKGSSFADVAEDAWYADAVGWAGAAGVVTGYSDGAFGPDETITRQQMAVMLARYAKLLGLDTAADTGVLAAFADGETTDSWAAAGMSWCVKAGIVKGRSNNVLDPGAAVTRAEVAVMFSRMVNLIR